MKYTYDDNYILIFDKRERIKKVLGLVRYAGWRGPGARLIPFLPESNQADPLPARGFIHKKKLQLKNFKLICASARQLLNGVNRTDYISNLSLWCHPPLLAQKVHVKARCTFRSYQFWASSLWWHRTSASAQHCSFDDQKAESLNSILASTPYVGTNFKQ